MDPVTIAAITAGSQAIGGAISNIGQGRKARKAAEDMNNRNIEFQDKTNKENREFALDSWHRMNEYNDPSAQMERYKAAGLNPNLIYGQSNMSAPIASPSTSAPHVEKEEREFFDYGKMAFEGSQNYMALRRQQTEISVQEQAMKVAEAQEGNIRMDTANKAVNNAKSQLELDIAMRLKNNTITNALLKTDQVQSEIDLLRERLVQTKGQTQLNQIQAEKLAQDIVNARQQAKILSIEGNVRKAELEIKNIELEIRRRGGNPNDSYIQKFLQESVFEPIKDFKSSSSDWLKKQSEKAYQDAAKRRK